MQNPRLLQCMGPENFWMEETFGELMTCGAYCKMMSLALWSARTWSPSVYLGRGHQCCFWVFRTLTPLSFHFSFLENYGKCLHERNFCNLREPAGWPWACQASDCSLKLQVHACHLVVGSHFPSRLFFFFFFLSKTRAFCLCRQWWVFFKAQTI